MTKSKDKYIQKFQCHNHAGLKDNDCHFKKKKKENHNQFSVDNDCWQKNHRNHDPLCLLIKNDIPLGS